MLDKDKEISSQIIAEKDNVESSETEDTLETDQLDWPAQEVEVLKLEPTQSPRKVEDDVGESLEPGRIGLFYHQHCHHHYHYHRHYQSNIKVIIIMIIVIIVVSTIIPVLSISVIIINIIIIIY